MMIKVPRRKGERTRRTLDRLGAWDQEIEIENDGDFVYIGVIRKLRPREEKEIGEFYYTRRKATRRESAPHGLAEALGGVLTDGELDELRTSFDIIGDIAILMIPEGLEEREGEIARALFRVHKNVRVVCKRVGAVEGDFRVRPLDIIAGPEVTVTTHKEHGCIYRLDLGEVFFTPRLATERERVAKQVKEGETIVDMFAGVGPFSILIAKSARPKKVYAVDLNVHAFEYLKKNIGLNHVEGLVEPILGDAKEVCKRLRADRVIMNLPKHAFGFLPVAIRMLDKGVIHYYCFGSKEALPGIVEEVRATVEGEGKGFRLIGSRFVRQVGPSEWNLALDLEVSSSR